ncbi:LAMI_0A03686g1_1 [Lachancea mirantina]|uniref:Mitochondrial transcription factor 1 n=1 Tax=Lachancea mirantina TaxID=1230905 RepID=A0A1G4INA1_9SACH|nr:LAMI_0A03686g1_1 [Lachancea mirantina]
MVKRIPGLKELSRIKHYYGFKYLLNPDIHREIYNKCELRKTYSRPESLKVLDLYSGPSQHSLILNEYLKPRQHVLMDSRPDFAKHITNLIDTTSMELYKRDPYDWESYTDMVKRDKLLVPATKNRDQIHSEFLVLANLTGLAGEGLFMQWLACIGNRNWLQQFGLVKMLVWVPEITAIKILAKSGDQIRSKCSVVAEAFTNTRLVATTNSDSLKKFSSGVLEGQSPLLISASDVWPPSGKPISLLEVNPKNHNIDLDNWDYVTKHLLILKGTPLRDAFESLGHGGKEYFSEKLWDEPLLDKCPRELTSGEFVRIAALFDIWPFKPDIYMDFIDVFQESE